MTKPVQYVEKYYIFLPQKQTGDREMKRIRIFFAFKAILLIGWLCISNNQLSSGQSLQGDIKFKASPSIAVVGSSVKLEWECEGSSNIEIRVKFQDGKDYPIATGKKNKDFAITDINYRHVPNTTFELIAPGKKGEKTRKKTITVRAFDKSQWVLVEEPWKDEGQIAGLIVSADGDRLYALIKVTGRDGSLWCSPNGFSEWEKINKNIPEGMTTSPAVYYKDKLVLVGGSKINPTHVFNEVHIFDLKTMKWKSNSNSKADWPPLRMGHAAIVFPDRKGDEKIWILGGADESGNGLNDIWTWNGRNWTQEQDPEWDVRCMFGAAANGSKLWIAGGLAEPDGKALPDIWKKNSKEDNWKQIMKSQTEPFRLLDSGQLSASTVVILNNQVYIIGYQDKGKTVKDRVVFYSIQEKRGFYQSQPQITRPELPLLSKPPSRIESVTFNGCIWLFTQGYLGKDRVENSGLYFWVPPASTSQK